MGYPHKMGFSRSSMHTCNTVTCHEGFPLSACVQLAFHKLDMGWSDVQYGQEICTPVQ